jgi:hypothetical protein
LLRIPLKFNLPGLEGDSRSRIFEPVMLLIDPAASCRRSRGRPMQLAKRLIFLFIEIEHVHRCSKHEPYHLPPDRSDAGTQAQTLP